MPQLLPIGLLLFAITLFFFARRLRQSTGVPVGRIVSSDTGRRREIVKPLYNHALRLTGKPDYIVELPSGEFIPVELKSGRPPNQPYPGHLLQLAAYCALVEENTGKRPPFGLLRYGQTTFEIDYTQDLEDELLDTLNDMRQDLRRKNVNRNHTIPAKCHACGVQHGCDQAL